MASLRKKSGHYYARFYDRNRRPKRKELALGERGDTVFQYPACEYAL